MSQRRRCIEKGTEREGTEREERARKRERQIKKDRKRRTKRESSQGKSTKRIRIFGKMIGSALGPVLVRSCRVACLLDLRVYVAATCPTVQ